MPKPFYKAKSVDDLRTECRGRGLFGAWVANARKPMLISALLALDGGDTVDSVQERYSRRWSGQPATEDPKPAPGDPLSGLAAWIRDQACDETKVRKIVEEIVAAKSIDPDAVRKIVEDLLGSLPPMRIQIPDLPEIDCRGEHPVYHRVVANLACGNRVWIAGPAGSGKTTAAERIGKALKFRTFMVPPQMTRYDVLGYKDAHSNTVLTEFSRWAAHEGDALLILDEVDSWLDGATLAANTALANGVCVLPDGPISIHDPKSDGSHYRKLVVATANTFGDGATSEYTGRQKLDAAFKNRFESKIDWPYDEAFELRLVKSAVPEGTDADPFVRFAQKVFRARAHCASKGLRLVISPRQTLAGVRLMLAGDSERNIWTEVITGGATPQQRADILKAAGVGA